jgi:hypothetical protein
MVLMYCVWQDGWFASVVGFGGPRNPTPDEVMMAVRSPLSSLPEMLLLS